MRQSTKRDIAREQIPDPTSTMTDDEVSSAFDLEIAGMAQTTVDTTRAQPKRRMSPLTVA